MPRLPLKAPTLNDAYGVISDLDAAELGRLIENTDAEPGGKYRHWHRFRNLQMPEGFSAEQAWAGVKLKRSGLWRNVGGLADLDGVPFRYARTDGLLERLHNLDLVTAGDVGVGSGPWNEEEQQRYIVRNFIEEAIASSQLEGASTTRQAAKEMIRHNRQPVDNAERMILNNYRGILKIGAVTEEPLSPELILDLHATLTEGTLENPDAVGRFQTPADERVVVGSATEREPAYIPPPAEAIPGLIDKLCDLANAEAGARWMHPLVRAVVLHFMLAWIHPFEDGNGRAARALFYWSAMRSNYWTVEYASISRILLDAPGQYATSFLEVETDENDLTYFILYQLDVIQRAIEQLYQYAETQAARARELGNRLRDLELNHRQEALLIHALRNPAGRYTFYSHAEAHRVVPLTARSDILELQELGLLVRDGMIGRAHAFAPTPNIHEVIELLSTE